MTISINKKKILLPFIAVLILGALAIGTFYAITFVRGVFQGVAGEIDLQKGAAIQFDFKKMKDLGIGVGQ